MSSWVVPVTHWQAVGEAEDPFVHLAAHGHLLVSWPPAPFERTPTYCYTIDDQFWVWQPEVGGVRFNAQPPDLVLLPLAGTDRAAFLHLVSRSWLPAIYPIWQRQVLHASAVASEGSGDVIAFTGPSGAGKSTTAYGVAQRRGWQLVADDTLAFSIDGHDRAEPRIDLYPLRNEARLRPATAEYFGEREPTEIPFAWPVVDLRLRIVYALDARDDHDGPPAYIELRAAESYPLLLQQAHAMTLSLREHNRRLMRDYLSLAAGIRVFRISFKKSFSDFGSVLDDIETHACRHGVTLGKTTPPFAADTGAAIAPGQ